ncbi:hypothetical protein ABZ820_39400 [Streptomyces diacarni]|uniref:Uncharacterized protein n=1 Tax=Streptomyces diacarni TaxID=2800381 RepID=A0A367ER40_9ACTN|nr:hypothetical protein [Streptomyces diacarni]RCG19650.1 hypothetical protein DTL70_23235 [Streptomyces diacarni]
MDTAKLELAAKRYREAEEAFNAAGLDLQAEAVALLRDPDDPTGVHSTVADVTGWTPGYVQQLQAVADAEEEEPAP